MQSHAFSTTHLALALTLALAWLDCIRLIRAQSTCTPHRDITNSTDAITANIREQAGINSGIADDVTVALQFERSNWANGSVARDDFYRVPPDTAGAPAGAMLKLQRNANTSAYTLPPNTAISRFMFQMKTLNGSTIPASAYVLWPFMPRIQPHEGGYPVIGWAKPLENPSTLTPSTPSWLPRCFLASTTFHPTPSSEVEVLDPSIWSCRTDIKNTWYYMPRSPPEEFRSTCWVHAGENVLGPRSPLQDSHPSTSPLSVPPNP